MKYELAYQFALALDDARKHVITDSAVIAKIAYIADHDVTVLPLKIRRLLPLVRRFMSLTWHEAAEEKYAVATKIFRAIEFYTEYIIGKGDTDENGCKKGDKEAFTRAVVSDCFRDSHKHIVDGKTTEVAKGLLH